MNDSIGSLFEHHIVVDFVPSSSRWSAVLRPRVSSRVKKKTQTNRRKIQYVREVDRVTFGRDAADGAVAAAVFEFAGRTGAGQRVGHARRRDGVHEGRLACSCNDRDGINFLSLSISFLLFRLPPPLPIPSP